MKLSQRKKRLMQSALGDVTAEIISECFDAADQESLAHPPDTWPDDLKARFDLLSEFEYKAWVRIIDVIEGTTLTLTTKE